MTTRRGRLLVLGGAWVGVIGFLTLRSDPAMREIVLTTPWYCLACGMGGATDIILNLLLFAPLGMIACALDWSVRRFALAALTLTVLIELFQGTFLIGRDATLGDVIANTLGAIAGWIVLRWLMSFREFSNRARWTTVTLLALHCLVWLGTAIGMRPSLEGPPPWVARTKRVGTVQDPFEGILLAATLDGIPVGMDPMATIPAPTDSLSLTVALARTSDRPPPHSASILRLVDGTPRAFIRLSQVRQGINLEVRMGLTEWRFRTPDIGFPHALEIPVGQPWQYEWRWHAQRVDLIRHPVGDTTAPVRESRRLSIGLGWAMMHPFLWVVDERAAGWTALWIGWWFCALAWCAGWAGLRFLVGAAVSGGVLFVGAGFATALPVSAGEIGAALAGLLVGALLATPGWKRPARQQPDGA